MKNHPFHSSFCGCQAVNSTASQTRRGFLTALGSVGSLGTLGTLDALGTLSSVGGLSAGAGLGLLGATSSKTAFAQNLPKPHRIDVHHHICPPEWVSALKKSHLDSPPVNNWTPQRSLDDMDKAGIATSMTSPTLPAVGFLPADEAARVARASNEYARRLADQYPGRFGVFALLPMPHVDETLKEIEYAFDVLKADGVAFMTSYADKYLGDKAFAPVMDELHRRRATAYTHPNDPACCLNLKSSVPPVIIEYGTDTTRTVASLIFSGTSARCKDINFIFSHGGGTLSSVTERFTVQVVSFPDFKQRGFTGESVMKEIKRFYYDTAQCSNPIAMASITKMVDVSQIVFGTDYPYRTGEDHVKGLSALFNAVDLKAIERENALRILPAHWRA
jgi:6-methylsalicylate decarboxylase